MINTTKDRWSALSLRDRAGLIKLYTDNGITNIKDIRKHYNSFGDGGRTEEKQPLSEKKLTLEEFLQAKADSTRNAAFEKSNVRKRGIEIVYPLEDKRRLQNMEYIGEHYVAHPDFVGPVRQKDYLINNPEFVKLHEQEFKELDNNCQYGYNCIGTATSEYPEDSRTIVNTDFQTNYQKYGFKIIPEEEALDGDIVQNINKEGKADHGMIYAGKDSDGNNLFNYSNGRITETSYRIHRPFPYDNQLFYRYVGTPELIQQWTKEYNTNGSKKYGGKLNSFATGGPTEELEPSSVTDYTSSKAEIEKAKQFVEDYYKSEAYKQRAQNSNLSEKIPLKKTLGLFPRKIVGREGLTTNESYKVLFPIIGLEPSENPIYKDLLDDIGNAAVHEYTHYNKIYNTKRGGDKNFTSPYYGMNYRKVPKEYYDLLQPTVINSSHDWELNENYSDLMGLRYLMQKHNIFDSMDPNATFNESNYKSLLKDKRYENDRFLKTHTKEQVIKAINDVAFLTDDKNFENLS